MAIDYQKTAVELVKALGSADNISKVTHCATRLRFILKDEEKADISLASKIEGVITVVEAGGQLQVVIGNHVSDAYKYVLEIVGNNEGSPEHHKQKSGVFNRIIDVISSIFAPFLYTLAACGILQGILGVIVALGWIDTGGGTYQILNFISWTAFTFLPVLIAITASKKFNMNTFIAVVIACALVCPDYIKMVESGADIFFLGIRVQLLSYTSTVIPIILAIWIASYVQRFFDKILPSVIRNLFSAMLTIAIMVPLTLLAFGPIGNAIGGAIGGVYNFFYNLSPVIAGIVVGGVWEILVIFGVHWGITPVTVGNYATLGYDTFTGLQASAVFSQAGATFGAMLKTKDKEMKKVALSAGITGLFGITEPAIYGVNLRLKKPMICGCIAGAVGGGIAGLFRSVSWSYNMPGIATLPAYFKEGYVRPFIGLLISIAVSFFLAMLLTYIVGFDEETPLQEEITREAETSRIIDSSQESDDDGGYFEIGCPVAGEVIPLNQVKDPAFSSKSMGDGVGIIPTDTKIYAPYDGTIEMLTDTRHAVGLKNSNGVETIIHIGIDTVKMNGKGFKAYVNTGGFVKKNDLLIEFDKALLEKEGFDTTVIFVVTDMGGNNNFKALPPGKAHVQKAIMSVGQEI